MNIYFARSIRGDHKAQDQLINGAILDAIRRAGMLPSLETEPLKRRTDLEWDQYVFLRDLDWINRASALIAEVTNPSLGVGYEIAYAYHERHLPIFCAAQKDTKVSAMITGNFDVLYYRDTSDLASAVETFLAEIASDNADTSAGAPARPTTEERS